MKKKLTSLAYLQNYRQLNIITRASNPKPHILTTNLSNALPHTPQASLLQLCFVDRNNKRESYFYVLFYNCGVLKTPHVHW